MREPQMHHQRLWAVLAAGLVLTGSTTSADQGSTDKLTESDAAAIAGEGYIYGYPLVLMDVSRQVMTAVPRPGRKRAPANQFNDSQEFPDTTFTDVVSPNADTLYSMAWLDLRKDPIVLSLPEMGDRYYLMPIMDAWTNVFASPGTRTTGNRKGNYAIVGPSWTGKLPDGMNLIKSPTSMVWIIGRTQTNGKADCAAVRAIKKQYTLTPLSAWGKLSAPPADVPVDPRIDARTAPVEQVDQLTASTFFARLAALLIDNPPAVADEPMLTRLARIGFRPGKPFDPATLDPAIANGLERGVKDAWVKLAAGAKSLSGAKHVNGWAVSLDMGRYGVDYQHRAVIAVVGLGANLPEDAVYPMAGVDGGGRPLTGANKYIISFAKGQLPPVNAFWSLTMYNSKRFFVANPLDRYAIGDRDRMNVNADGSLTIYLQADSPGKDLQSNWLPAPRDGFNLILRLYWPKPDVLDGTWKPPAVERAQ
jgi:hypothetical protein